MKGVGAILFLALSAACAWLFPSPALAAEPPSRAVAGVVFAAQPVRAPVAPEAVAAEAPFVPADVPEVAGTVRLDATHAAAFWLDPLDVVRVRRIDGGAASGLRFARILGGGHARARVDEPGVPAGDGITWLAQPPGRGDVWLVSATAATRVRVERPVRRPGRLVWEHAQAAIVAWVDAGGEVPALPLGEGTRAFVLRLHAEERLGRALLEAFPGPRLARAVRAWRKASALAGFLALRPLTGAFFRATAVDEDLAGLGGSVDVADEDATHPYRRLDAPTREWTVSLEGPGVLRVEARARFSGEVLASAPPEVALAVSSGGVLLGRRAVQAQPTMAPDETEPPPAFPRRVPLRSSAGDYLGDRVVVTVPLYPGRNDYQLDVAGGPLALRVTAARRRARVGEALRGVADAGAFVEEARAALTGDDAPGARVLARLLDDLDGRAAPAPDLRELPPLLALVALAGGDGKGDAAALVRALPASAAPELVWSLVLRAARRLYGRHEYTPLRALLHAAPGLPPAPLLPELVQLLPPPTPLERLRSQPVAALDVAWREDPMDPAIAQGYRAAWRGSAWALVPPSRDEGEAAPPRPSTWLCEAGEPSASPTHAEEPPRLYEPGGLWRLPVGQTVRVVAPPSPVDATRAALVTLYVETPAAHVGPLSVRVDGKSFHALGIDALERLELAVAPGVHELRLDAPAGTSAWSGLAPAEGTIAAGDTARLRHYWPLADGGKPVRYPLPGADLPGPVQISLRVLAGAGQGPVRVTVHADVGAATVLTLRPGAADPLAHAAAAPGAVGDEVTLVVRPPPGARTMWLDTDGDARVFAALSVRRDRSPAPAADAAAPPAPPTAAGVLGKVAALSRTLAKNPGDAAALVRRAELLLDLGQADLARQDLLRLVGLPAAAQDAWLAAAEDDLIARLDAWSTPSHIVLAEATRAPVAVAPALLVLAPSAQALAPYEPAITAARTRGIDAGLAALPAAAARGADPLASYLAARLRAERGEAAAAGLALLALDQASGRWQVGLEALDDLAAALADPAHAPPGIAPITFGLAQGLRAQVDHPRLRRALVVAAALSRWDVLDGTSANAGSEHVFSSAAADPPSPLAATREALVAAPWPTERAHTVTAGSGAALELTVSAPTTIAAQVFCLEVKLGQPAGEPCALSVRIDDGRKQPRKARVGAVTDVPVATLAPGRHLVEVVLDDDSEGHLASVRFVSERALPGGLSAAEERGRFPVKLERRQSGFVAQAAQPIEVTIVGPAALWVQARAIDPAAGARELVVTAVPRRGGHTVATRAALPATLDADAHGDPGRALAVSPPGDVYLVLPDAVPYAVTVAPTRGKLVARLALREDKAGKAPRTPGPWWLAAADTPGIFALADAGCSSPADEQGPRPGFAGPGCHPHDRAERGRAYMIDGEVWEGTSPGSLGTFSAELGVDQESRDEEDALPPQVLARTQARASWRYLAVPRHLWLRLSGWARWREETSLVVGGAADVNLDELPGGFFLELSGSLFQQTLTEGSASDLDVGGSFGRSFRLGDSLVLTPRLGLRQSFLTRPKDVPAMEPVDPDVWNSYRADHLRRASGRLLLSWLPFQDLYGGVGADAATNDDLASLDHASLFVQERSLLPIPGLPETLLALDYRPTYRFADRDRPTAFVRHDLSAQLSWSLWTGDAGRFVLSIWDDLFLSPGLATRNVFGVSLRFDLTRGRGLSDFQPDEGLFDELVEHREWAAAPPDVR